MALNTYATGTVSVTAGGTTVTGSGTIWSGNKAVAGDEFVIGGVRALIVDVVDVTHLTITPWPGADQSGASYAIYQTSSQRFDDVNLAINTGKVADVWTSDGFYVYVPSTATAPDPSLGDDGQFGFQAVTGKLWLKEAGVWTFLGIYKGFNFRGAYDAGATYSVNDVFTSDGSAYIVTAAPPAGTTPPNATYYDVLAAGGAAATVAVGTTTTGEPGTDASVTNSGTSSAAVLDFAIPAGQPPLKPIEAWATGTAYVVGPPASFVSQGGSAYECLIAHTSGTFSVDLAAGKWGLVALKGQDGTGTGDMQAANNLSELTQPWTAKDNISLYAGAIDAAATVDLESVEGDYVTLSAAAATSVNAITLNQGHERTVFVNGDITFVNGADLALPGARDIVASAGDIAIFRGTTSNFARCIGYLPGAPAPGTVVQFVSAIDATYQSGTTNFAFGDSAPTNTEGTQLLTCAITPKFASSKLVIRFNARVAGDASNTVGVALFVSGTSTSISAEQFTVPSADAGTTLSDEYVMTAGTTSALTFSLRVGCASAHVWYVNGTSAGRRFGGTMKTAITITEVKA